MKIHKSQSGFTALHALLLLVLVGIVGFAGWRVYETQKETDKSFTNASDANEVVKKEKAEEAEKPKEYSGQVVEAAHKSFSLKIPDGWKVRLIEEEDLIVSDFGGSNLSSYAASLEYTPGTAPVVTRQSGFGTDAPIRFTVRVSSSDLNNPLDGDEQTSEFVTGEGKKGTRYYKQYPVRPMEGLGPYAGEKQYTYEFNTNDKKVRVAYRILEKNQYTEINLPESDKDRLELIEQVVKTLVIK